MRQHRSHLADGGHLLGMQRMLVGALEFARLLLDPLFKSMSPGDVLVVLRVQPEAHVIEGGGEVTDFVVGVHFNLIAEIARGQAFSAAFQRFYRPAYDLPHEEPAQERDQQQGAARVDNHAAAAFGDLNVGLGERKIGVEDAENPLLRGMRVAGGVRARGLILDRSDNAQHAGFRGVAINAKAIGAIQPRQRLRLGVAGIAGFGGLIDHVVLFGRIGGVGDSAFLIEDADLLHARLAAIICIKWYRPSRSLRSMYSVVLCRMRSLMRSALSRVFCSR